METKSLIESLKYNFTGFKKILPQVIKYQIITKFILAVLIVPLYRWITLIIIESTGIPAVSNDDLMNFLFSPQGILFLIIGVIFLQLSWHWRFLALLQSVPGALWGRRKSVIWSS